MPIGINQGELVISVNPSASSGYEDGDIVNAYDWDKILAMRAEAEGEWPPYVCPMSDTMLSHFLILRLVGFSAADALLYRASNATKRIHYVDWRNSLGLTAGQIADIEDRDTVVDIRETVFNPAIIATKD